MRPDTEETAIDYVEMAIEKYSYRDNEIEIDADATVSESNDGAWVQAWVWVADDE